MILHATTVSVDGAGLTILGPSGSGKSGIALQMIASGAKLVADDRTVLSRPDEGPPLAEAPRAISGLIEARGFGLIEVPVVTSARLAAILDLGFLEAARLPAPRFRDILGFSLPLIHRVEAPWFAAALVLWLRSGGSTSSRLGSQGHT